VERINLTLTRSERFSIERFKREFKNFVDEKIKGFLNNNDD